MLTFYLVYYHSFPVLHFFLNCFSMGLQINDNNTTEEISLQQILEHMLISHHHPYSCGCRRTKQSYHIPSPENDDANQQNFPPQFQFNQFYINQHNILMLNISCGVNMHTRQVMALQVTQPKSGSTGSIKMCSRSMYSI